jgi:methanesulfonate monooxygenase subunit beta
VSHREAIERLIYESGIRLDQMDYQGYLALCADDYQYTIQAYSPEIRKDMIWLQHDKGGMDTLFKNLPRHNSDHSTLMRHLTVYTVDVDEASGAASVVSALQVFRTELDGGTTELFAVGKQHDTIELNGGSPKLGKRTIRLETRNLGIGHHVPF